MARIPQDEIDRLKHEVALQRLAETAGVKLNRHGKDLIGLCPFHDDKEPSLVITPAKNLWNCLGACRTGGTPIEWVMKAHGVGFRHAIELLRDGAPSSLAASPVNPVKHSSVRFLERPFDPSATDGEVLAQVVAFYHEQLRQSPEALGYLERRGLGSSEAIEHFKLGFANRTLGYRLPEKNRKEGDELRGRLQQLGILRESGHEHFNGSVVVPVFDAAGQVVEIYGRKVTAGLRKGTPLHLYLPGPHHGVWNEAALNASKDVILCEALFDALTFWSNGYRNVTASYGVNGFTDEHLEAFARHGTKRVLIAYDRDEAGDRAAAALADRLLAAGIGCGRIEFPRGMDANEYALKVTPAAKSLGVLVRRATWLGQGMAPQLAATTEEIQVEPAPLVPDLVADAGGIEADLAPRAPLRAPTPAAEPVAAAPEDPLATPAPQPTPVDVVTEETDDAVMVRFANRGYRVRGLPVGTSFDLRIALHAGRLDTASGAFDAVHGYVVDRLDLYAASQRARFAKLVAAELGFTEAVVQRDLGRLVFALERVQEERRKQAEAPPVKPADGMAADEREQALALLRDPNLLDRILQDFERCGVVGEETNKLLGYLAAVSRKLEEPLAVLVQSSSAAGKSVLMEAILQLVPDEDRVSFSAMTDQSLYYMGERQLKHKVLAIAEEEGASRASYALKLLQSEGELTIASTTKDADTGKLVTEQYRVEGPVMLLLTTTAIDIDEELMNRCIVLTVDEDRAQTRAIHRRQRERQTLEGLLARRDAEAVRKLHRNAQRLLRPLLVANPYAPELSFVDERTRTRRDHIKYLTLIRAITFLHQHQRPVKTVRHAGEEVEYIEVRLADIEVANRLAHQVLGRSLDELAPQTRSLLGKLDRLVEARTSAERIDRRDVRFTRREVRAFTGWSLEQVRIHLGRLVELEYVAVHGGRRGQSFVYELVYAGEGGDGRPFLMGLTDIDVLRATTTCELPGSAPGLPDAEAKLPGSNRPQTGPKPAPYRTPEIADNGNDDEELRDDDAHASEMSIDPEPALDLPSYTSDRRTHTSRFHRLPRVKVN